MRKKHSSPTKLTILPASFFRRVAALVYDSFIVFSFLMLATAIALLVNRGESLTPYQTPFLIYLLLSTGLFLSWFWRKGQTLGMLAWKIKVVDLANQPLTWSKAFSRYWVAIFSWGIAGLGFLWCLLDKEKRTLYDRASGTKVIHLKME